LLLESEHLQIHRLRAASVITEALSHDATSIARFDIAVVGGAAILVCFQPNSAKCHPSKRFALTVAFGKEMSTTANGSATVLALLVVSVASLIGADSEKNTSFGGRVICKVTLEGESRDGASYGGEKRRDVELHDEDESKLIGWLKEV